MKKNNFTIVFLLFVLISFSQEKQIKNQSLHLDKISKIAKETKSIEANFTQEKTVSYLAKVAKSSGKFYTQNGDMRWELTKPYSYIMLLTESGVQVKDEGKEKQYGAMADKFMAQIRNILLSSIDGSFVNNKEFSPQYFIDNNYFIVKLTPVNRRLAKMFKGINLNFDLETYRLKTLTFVQDDGESIMYFSNEKFNTDLQKNLFTKF